MDELDHASPEAETALGSADTMEALEAALQAVLALQWTLGDRALHGHKLFCRGLDRLVPAVARRLGLPDVALPAGRRDALIVATQFYAVGGHSRVAEDISAILGQDQVVAVLTDAFGKLRHRQLLGGIAGREKRWQRSVLLLGARTAVEKIVELYGLVAALRPGRIFLLAHHMDIVATVALWSFRGVVEFVHHADHLPALGATLPFARHADVTYTCHQACRAAGIDAAYAGLTAAVPAASGTYLPFSRPDRVRIATCGSQNKYLGHGEHDWIAFAAAALALRGAEILHIGPADQTFRSGIVDGLTRRGIDPHRYVFAGPTPSLADALVVREADAYLGSYPESGGKASFEAMMVGLRPLVLVDRSTPPLLRLQYPVPAWHGIEQPGQVAGAIMAMRSRTWDDIARDMATARQEASRFEDYVRGT